MEERWQSKGMLSIEHLLAAKVPVLNVGDVGSGGTSSANCAVGWLHRERALHPPGLGFWQLFALCICFAGP